MAVKIGARAGKARGMFVAALLLAGLTAAQLFALRNLPYSKASLSSVSLNQALTPAAPLVLDGLSWQPDRYKQAASLQPMRDLVREHCPEQSGFALATCISNVFAARFANGHPSHEFFDRRHDPAAVFAAHLAGETGHCVTRSGMLAVALLATGNPARVVQILGKDGGAGHNVIEVWAPPRGWRVLDPSFAGLPESADGSTSAVALTQPPFPSWRPEPTLHRVPGVDQREALTTYAENHLRGASVIYPEPWLYTRVGSPHAPWPFHGRFVIVGPRTLPLGLGQPLLQVGIAISLLGCLLLAAAAIVSLARGQAGPQAAAVQAPPPADAHAPLERSQSTS